jgi:hypothetical protein
MSQAPRIATLVAVALLVLACSTTASASTTKVMTRNLYLCADVGVALKLLPDMPAAAQFMWNQVEATNFDQRAPRFAAEAARERPDVIALQEATTWSCSTGLGGNQRVVFDFTRQFLAATRAMGTPYVLATAGGETARNLGFSLGPIPFLTKIHDPATFQPLFGTDDADCGFQIGDALAVRADLAPHVLAAGIADTTLVGRGKLPVRCVRNQFTAAVDAAEQRGEDTETLAALWASHSLKEAALEGNADWGKLEAGQSVGLIDSLVPAGALVQQLMAECETARQRLAAL